MVLVFCFLAIGSGADDQPVKRVMNFIAVMDLRCGTAIDKETGVALTEMLINEMVKMKKFTVIDRANRDKILSEAGYQQTACVDESCTIEMGRQLGVGKIIVGSISKVGKTYVVNLQLINVETAAIETSASETCEGCEVDKLIGSITTAAHKLMGEEPQPSSAAYTVNLQLLNVGTVAIEKTVNEDCGNDTESIRNAVMNATRKLLEGIITGMREKSDVEAGKNDIGTVNTNAQNISSQLEITSLAIERIQLAANSKITIAKAGKKVQPPPKSREGKFILVMDLQCGPGISSEICGQMTETVRNEAQYLGWSAVDKNTVAEIIKRMPSSSCRDTSCLAEIGRLVRAETVVTGSINKKQ